MAKKIKVKPGVMLAKSALASKKIVRGIEAHPYSLARIIEDADVLPGLDGQTRRRLKAKWSITKVDDLSTEAILEKLRALARPVNEADFKSLALAHRSAWDMSRRFSDGLGGDDDDFLGLAFCALWKRWLPERPSIEMIDDWILEGRVCSEEHDHDRGLATWRRAWDVLRGMLDESTTTIAAAERKAFPGLCSLRDWIHDYVEQHIHVSPAFVDEGARLIDELIAQFRGEEPSFKQDLLIYKADIYLVADRFDDAERVSREIIERWPKNAVGYVMLAEVFAKAKRTDDAAAALETALGVPVVDAANFDLELRLEALRDGSRAPG